MSDFHIAPRWRPLISDTLMNPAVYEIIVEAERAGIQGLRLSCSSELQEDVQMGQGRQRRTQWLWRRDNKLNVPAVFMKGDCFLRSDTFLLWLTELWMFIRLSCLPSFESLTHFCQGLGLIWCFSTCLWWKDYLVLMFLRLLLVRHPGTTSELFYLSKSSAVEEFQLFPTNNW